MAPEYPVTKRVDTIDEYHGVSVPDPYRWLEEPSDTPEVRAWIDAQMSATGEYLGESPLAGAIRERLRELWNYHRTGATFRRGERYFQFRNTGLQNQDVLYVMNSPTEEGRVLLDPNAFAADGKVALVGTSVSPDGELLAYAVSEAGSDWNTWRFRRIATGDELPDVLDWVKFSQATWQPNAGGVYYQRFPAPDEQNRYTARNESPQLCYHRLGTPQELDEVILERPEEPEWMFHAVVSNDDRYLVVAVNRSTESRNLLYYRSLEGGEFIPLVAEFEHEVLFLGNDGDTFYLQTDRGEGRGKIVAVDLAKPGEWREVVPESEHPLESALLVKDEFLLVYQEHACHRLRRVGTDGKPRDSVTLPQVGSIAGIAAERDHDEAFFLFASFLEPPVAYRLDLTGGKLERLSQPALPFDAGGYEVRQEFARSKDGTRVPIFLVHRRGLVLDGQNPLLLYGYGGFNVSLTPVFSVSRLAWLERGGVLAVANLRGGGEYGRDWHEAGILDRKQNVFDDFIACAEHLIELGYTSPRRLAIQGGSNGGLLVAACMIQRPELFGAVHTAVGVLDMLRYHLFTIGSRWASDYGRADDPRHFAFLRAYSPLHNIVEGACYPATLITTGDHDDRVVPAHSFKFAAALQHAQGCERPILLRVETRAGHGMGKPTEALIAEQADIWAFLLRELAAEADLVAETQASP